MTASRDYYRALGYLTYALSHVDGDVEEAEHEKFARDLLKTFGRWIADTKGMASIATYESAVNNEFSVDKAYDEAIRLFGLCKDDLGNYRLELISILENVAHSDKNYCEKEDALIDRFREDSLKLVNQAE